MDVQDRSRSPSRRTSRVEQVVGRWLRRSRDLGSRSHSLGRDRSVADGKTESGGSDQRNYPFRFNIQIHRDAPLNSHGLSLSTQTPILVAEVTPGGPADGRLVPGDQLVKINNVAVDDLTPEQAAEIIRECQDTVTMTILRTMLGPKSSFITPEKRAKLKSNPVKVHFAEEVEVNGHCQGNSLLFLPNVLKVYLENGQTKAFKFEPSTTVKDIVMTLKEKLSLSRIEHFSLVLEQQHSISKLLLLHDEERIQQVVQKKEAHDYRCLFRLCFMPKIFDTLLQEDPTAFEYLYLQAVNDVLQERFAVEMRCNTALRLAALHIQERLVSCGQSPKTNLKIIMKTWGIENFVSSTLLRNMRDKDLKKAISYHMKKSQSQHDPKQKNLSTSQARINYLEELVDLKSFGGKSFSATMMLQDRESTVTLLVGARYGVSQVVNHKLSIMSTLTEFNCITRIELLPESEKVSLVKIYLQDIKPITLLLESMAAKDLSCLIAGYCKVFVDPALNIFLWTGDPKKHRVSAEEGYVSRCGSDSDDASDLDMEPVLDLKSLTEKHRLSIRSPSSEFIGRKRKDKRRNKDAKEVASKSLDNEKQEEEKDADTEKKMSSLDKTESEETACGLEEEKTQDNGRLHTEETEQEQREAPVGEEKVDGETCLLAEERTCFSEASDSCHSDSRVLTSPSSDSLDALEDDNLLLCSSSFSHLNASAQTHFHLELDHYSQRQVEPHQPAPPPSHSHPFLHITSLEQGGEQGKKFSEILHQPQRYSSNPCSDESSLCSFAELSRLVDLLPSPPEASEDDEDVEEELRMRRFMLKEVGVTLRGVSEEGNLNVETGLKENTMSVSPSSSSYHTECVFNFNQSDARCYYKLCSNITPDSAHSIPRPSHQNDSEDSERVEEDEDKAEDLESIPILQPPPGFGDSSSDEEFFDARDRLTSPEDPALVAAPKDTSTERKLQHLSALSLSDIRVSVIDEETAESTTEEGEYMKVGESEGEDKKTLFQLRRQSRKRRSFMETSYTSMVSYPESEPEFKTDADIHKLHKSFLKEARDSQMLSPEPEASVQTHSPSPTVASLTHSEGEPAQLESKPILSKATAAAAGPSSDSCPTTPHNSSRTRKQDMEMEPDTMESKSVTDVVKAASSPIITVVRCRVDPDGTESADRRGDGKEEGEGQEEVGQRKEEDEVTGVSREVPFTSHMFLPVIVGKQNIDDVEEEKQSLRICSVDENNKDADHLSRSHVTSQEINIGIAEHELEGACDISNSSPPRPPPSSPLAPVPRFHKCQGDCPTGGNKDNTEVSSDQTQLDTPCLTSVEDKATCVGGSADEISDSTNSDNVFEDEDVGVSLNFSSCGKKDNASLATKLSNSSTLVTASQCESVTATDSQTTVCSANSNHSRAINSTADTHETAVSNTAKHETAVSNTCSSFDLEPTSEHTLFSDKNANEHKSDCTVPIAEERSNPDLPSSCSARIHVSIEPPSPTQFFFQTCSPSIMGPLSSSTLRGKIQNLPMYLSRSQETLQLAGARDVAQTNTTQTAHEIIQTSHRDDAETVDSDDSDTTITGSEADVEIFEESTPIKTLCSLLPIQSEPKPKQQHQTDPFEDTPGPITEPPTSIAKCLLGDTSNTPRLMQQDPEPSIITAPHEDIPSSKLANHSPSSPVPVVVTTQNVSRAGLSFHNQPPKVDWTDNDRPLTSLCRPSKQSFNSPKTLASGCTIFTICEDPSQTETSAELGTTSKAEYGCSPVLTAGCESVVEGLQVPLNSCGCPEVYTSCFSGGDSFDEELTVYEFSCRANKNSDVTQTTGAVIPLMTSSSASSCLSTSSTNSPSFPRSILFSSSTSELSPLLSPLSETSDCFLSETHKNIISRLGQQCYPEPPVGFQELRVDVNQLLSILECSTGDRAPEGQGGRHPRDTCPAHFTANKRLLQTEARHLMTSCQKVVGSGQSPEDMLNSLAESFRTLVELAGICLWFSGCDRCDRRNVEAVAGLADVARSFRDFCLAAERASSKRSCQDLSTKLLTKQCTALTASVFCLTQLFRTLTAL